MEPIEFPQQTLILAENQPEYKPLPCHIVYESCRYKNQETGEETVINVPWEMVACFKLSPEEIAEIVRTGVLWYKQAVFGDQFKPIYLSTLNPFSEPQATGTPMKTPEIY
jgi:hypothetical protein